MFSALFDAANSAPVTELFERSVPPRTARRAAGLWLFALLIVALSLGGCGEKAERGVAIIAILPFDNLTSSREFDWFSSAGPSLLAYQLYGQRDVFALNTSPNNDAVAAHATVWLHTRFSKQGGDLLVTAEEEDGASHRITLHRAFRVSASPEGALAAVNDLERTIAPRARPVNADVAAALVPYGRALLSTDPGAQAQLLGEAIRIAPEFTPAWLSRIELDAQQHNPGAADDIAAAMQSANNLDRARLECLRAALSGDEGAEVRAFAELTRRVPSDGAAFGRLAELQTKARDFAEAASAWGNVAKLQPWNQRAFNQLGYCRGWAGDYDGAARAFAAYEKLAPRDPNPLDSLGEVQFFFGRYHEAEASFLRAEKKDPAFFGGVELLKAAEARLMTGDRGGADGLFAKYAAWRRNSLHDPLLPLEKAQWDFLGGRRRQAMSELSAALPQFEGDGRSRAESQLAFWMYASGDLAGARTHADVALREARTLESKEVAALCRFLASPSASATEWSARADKELRGAPAQFREAALGYALALDYHPAEAIPLLGHVEASAQPGEDGEPRAMLASALMAAGRQGEARKLLRQMPIPLSSEMATFAALVFPRWLEWTGQQDKFRTFSGDLRLRFE